MQRSEPPQDQVFTAHEGMVLHRGVYLPMETALALLPNLARQKWSQGIAKQLAEAISEVTEDELERTLVHA